MSREVSQRFGVQVGDALRGEFDEFERRNAVLKREVDQVNKDEIGLVGLVFFVDVHDVQKAQFAYALKPS